MGDFKYEFRDMTSKNPLDIIEFITDYIVEKPLADVSEDGNILVDGTKIYIGCDSQNVKDETIYAIVIVLHYKNQGGKVLYCKFRMKRIVDSFVRLWNEVDHSIEVANYILDKLNIRPYYIELDLNPDPIYQSNAVLRSALGYVESYGYRGRCKPNLLSTVMSDHICKARKKRRYYKSKKK